MGLIALARLPSYEGEVGLAVHRHAPGPFFAVLVVAGGPWGGQRVRACEGVFVGVVVGVR